jgi:hypothetical protein
VTIFDELAIYEDDLEDEKYYTESAADSLSRNLFQRLKDPYQTNPESEQKNSLFRIYIKFNRNNFVQEDMVRQSPIDLFMKIYVDIKRFKASILVKINQHITGFLFEDICKNVDYAQEKYDLLLKTYTTLEPEFSIRMDIAAMYHRDDIFDDICRSISVQQQVEHYLNLTIVFPIN